MEGKDQHIGTALITQIQYQDIRDKYLIQVKVKIVFSFYEWDSYHRKAIEVELYKLNYRSMGFDYKMQQNNVTLMINMNKIGLTENEIIREIKPILKDLKLFLINA